ncbi:hypothetical protein [Pyrobaculum aerophilum]|uniref:hypothetical protein n=1 Tax=Pyrobaculum aerophilum TaxID=13773 RepID=UPI0011C06035|nr:MULTISPECIES: hypothetical protein [Pyrobaculum]
MRLENEMALVLTALTADLASTFPLESLSKKSFEIGDLPIFLSPASTTTRVTAAGTLSSLRPTS